MGMPYRARINERTLLNLPDLYADDAHVFIYVEDTSERLLEEDCRYCPDCDCPSNFEPVTVLEIADGRSVVRLRFDLDTARQRESSLHKLDTLEIAIRVFRDAFLAEFEPYDQREASLESLRD
jgi:hypothetical protein